MRCVMRLVRACLQVDYEVGTGRNTRIKHYVAIVRHFLCVPNPRGTGLPLELALLDFMVMKEPSGRCYRAHDIDSTSMLYPVELCSIGRKLASAHPHGFMKKGKDSFFLPYFAPGFDVLS